LDWTAIVIGIICFLVGILFVFFSRHFIIWFGRYKFEHNLNVSPEGNKKTSTKSKEEFIKTYTEVKGFRRTIWLIGLTGIRILGLMFITASILILTFEIFHIQ
jgi:hypothetical protein